MFVWLSGTHTRAGDEGRGRWVSVKQQVLFFVCLFDHNCEKVEDAVGVGKCVEGLNQGVYFCAYVCARVWETERFEGRWDKYQWKM